MLFDAVELLAEVAVLVLGVHALLVSLALRLCVCACSLLLLRLLFLEGLENLSDFGFSHQTFISWLHHQESPTLP